MRSYRTLFFISCVLLVAFLGIVVLESSQNKIVFSSNNNKSFQASRSTRTIINKKIEETDIDKLSIVLTNQIQTSKFTNNGEVIASYKFSFEDSKLRIDLQLSDSLPFEIRQRYLLYISFVAINSFVSKKEISPEIYTQTFSELKL